ncbi:MAG: O-antigen ligase family protein [Candidatus Nomurabacteria bacterium]|nr:O-antigen ligase family protein [Candidatus Nomurabacteria bacterium]
MKKFAEWLRLPRRIGWFEKLLLIAPLAVYFSYKPTITLARGSYGTHFELSLLQIYLVILALSGLKSLWQNRRAIWRDRAILVAAATALLLTISLIWTPEKLRGLLTAGLIWLIWLIFVEIKSLKNPLKLAPALVQMILLSGLIMAIVGLAQMLLDLIGVSRRLDGLCPGCVFGQFGFTRISGLANEPQFFGSLISLPLLILFNRILSRSAGRRSYALAILLAAVEILTLSRGAIYSLIAAALILIIVRKKIWRQIARLLAVGVAGCLIGFLIQGLDAQINPATSATFRSALSGSLNQLTMGKIRLPAIRSNGEQNAQKPSAQITEKSSQTPAKFSGYVEKSTDERTAGWCLALTIAKNSPRHLLVGIGVGGTGYYFNQYLTSNGGYPKWCKTSL